MSAGTADGGSGTSEPGTPPEATPRPKESLRRELLAILFLYGVLSLIPLAIGWAFAPA